MKQINLKKYLKVAGILTSTSLLLTAIGFGCGQGFNSTDLGSVSPANQPLITGENPDTGSQRIVPGVRTVSVPVFTSAYNSLIGALQVPVPTPLAGNDALVTAYRSQLGGFSENGSAASITPSLMLAYSTISAEVCLKRINLELAAAANTRLFFNDVSSPAATTGNGAAQIPDTALASTINRLARATWQRNESAEERTEIISSLRTLGTISTTNALLYVCTVVASSASGLEM